jgi:peptide/nickel transport system ATP-binding protein
MNSSAPFVESNAAEPTGRSSALLSVRGLRKHFTEDSLINRLLGEESVVKAVDGVSFDLAEGETLGIVGESGCGKSTLAKTVVRLHDPTAGRIVFDGVDVTENSRRELKTFREDVQMIFQDPHGSLNPRDSVRKCIADGLRIHDYPAAERDERVAELLELVGLSERFAERYPSTLSGGQAQRVSIARALAVDPDLLIADEPTSALDVSVQAQILDILDELKAELGLSMMFISHNLKVVKYVSDRIMVMYLGEPMELGEADDIIDDPIHPYTRALVESIPRMTGADQELSVLEGEVPDPSDPPPGCPFQTRCPDVMTECREVKPDFERKDGYDRKALCHLYESAPGD